jgi:hypothetical protein
MGNSINIFKYYKLIICSIHCLIYNLPLILFITFITLFINLTIILTNILIPKELNFIFYLLHFLYTCYDIYINK